LQSDALELQKNQLDLLFRHSLPAPFISVAIGFLLAWILSKGTTSNAPWLWFAGVAVFSAIRALLFGLYFVVKPSRDRLLAWQAPYMVTLVFGSGIWGFGTLWLIPADSLLYQVVILYFLMGMAGGGLAVYLTIRSMTIVSVTLVLMPVTLWMLWQGDSLHVALGCASVLYMLSAVRATRVIGKAFSNNYFLTRELESAKTNAEAMARTDALTGLNNRWAFMELASQTLRICQRKQRPVAVIILDMDSFKSINDNHGHNVGDMALQRAAEIIARTIRCSDIAVRFGGEEFAVFLPDTTLDEGIGVAEKLRAAIEEKPLSVQGVDIRLTASVGVAGKGYDLTRLLKEADIAMYKAKENGRNKVYAARHPDS
jgi:diguanylate cyclase (GGDEF)-like protein